MKLAVIHIDELEPKAFLDTFEREGYVVVEGVIDPNSADIMADKLREAIQIETDTYHSPEHEDYGMLIACPIYDEDFLLLPNNRQLMDPFNWILGETCIIWSYTSSSMEPGKGNHATRIHVDWPHFIPGFNPGVGSLVLLTDFNEENGATYILPRSHKMKDQPEESYFYENSIRLIAPKGSVFYFNLRLWHAGGINRSTRWRHSLGIGMTRPNFKQKIDLPRALKDFDLSKLNWYGRQKLGFFSQPPTSVQEYYQNARNPQHRQRSEWETT